MKRRLFLPGLWVSIALVGASTYSHSQVATTEMSPSAPRADSMARQFQRDMAGARGLSGASTMEITFNDNSVLLFDLVRSAPNPRYRPQGSKAQEFMRHVKNLDLTSEGFTFTFADGSTTSFDLGKSISANREK